MTRNSRVSASDVKDNGELRGRALKVQADLCVALSLINLLRLGTAGAVAQESTHPSRVNR